jgi:hypothetical protein
MESAVRNRVCSVCGAENPILGILGGEMHEERLCHYCWIWFASTSLYQTGPKWGRDQVHRIRFVPQSDWRERALACDWPEPAFLSLLGERREEDDPTFVWSKTASPRLPDSND